MIVSGIGLVLLAAIVLFVRRATASTRMRNGIESQIRAMWQRRGAVNAAEQDDIALDMLNALCANARSKREMDAALRAVRAAGPRMVRDKRRMALLNEHLEVLARTRGMR